MEILSGSLFVCRALSAQWRSVGAVAPERVVASFLCSRFVSCTCALLWMFILTHATALKPFHSKQSYPLHHLQHIVRRPEFLAIRTDGPLGKETTVQHPDSPLTEDEEGGSNLELHCRVLLVERAHPARASRPRRRESLPTPSSTQVACRSSHTRRGQNAVDTRSTSVFQGSVRTNTTWSTSHTAHAATLASNALSVSTNYTNISKDTHRTHYQPITLLSKVCSLVATIGLCVLAVTRDVGGEAGACAGERWKRPAATKRQSPPPEPAPAEEAPIDKTTKQK